jgi:hypothetical protein
MNHPSAALGMGREPALEEVGPEANRRPTDAILPATRFDAKR